MKNSIFLRVGMMMALAVLAISVFVWLYTRTTDLDAARHERVLGLTDQVAQLDARWNVDVMKSATDLNKDYDPLTAPLMQWPALRQSLERDLPLVLDAATAKSYTESLTTLFDQKTALVSQFKMRNAVLKNSLRYLPTAQAEIGGITDSATDRTVQESKRFSALAGQVDASLRTLATSGDGEPSSRATLARNALLSLRAATAQSGQLHSTLAMSVTTGTSGALVSNALRFNLSPEEATMSALKFQNEELKKALPNLPIQLRDGSENLTKHIDLVLRERPEVTRLLTSIAGSPITPTLDKLKTAINDRFVATAGSQKLYEHLLQGYAVFLLVSLLVAATLLMRNWMRLATDARLMKAQLGEAEIRLLQADRNATIGQLSANIAHEINTPLASAQGAMQNLSEVITSLLPALAKSDDPAVKQALEDVEFCIQDGTGGLSQIRAVIENLLDFVRGNKTSFEQSSIEGLLATSLKMLTSTMKGNGVEVVTHFAQLPDVECNGTSLRQVFVNLCRNAAEAMPDGGTLTVATSRKDRNVQITVTDTGTGITPEVLPHIFEANFTTKKTGTGVGLAITKNIIEQHHGKLSVHSAPDNGTTFTILLPIKQPVAAEQPRRAVNEDEGLLHA